MKNQLRPNIALRATGGSLVENISSSAISLSSTTSTFQLVNVDKEKSKPILVRRELKYKKILDANQIWGGNMTNEEKIIELLQNLIIIVLHKEGVSRENIRKILSISPNKISKIEKYLNKTKRNENE